MKRRYIPLLLLSCFCLYSQLFFLPSYAVDANIILNPSVETSANSLPANWSKDFWGTNTRVFTYASEGYNSSKSLYVKISNYKNGDAKWSFDAVNVSPNTEYTFTNYYKSTVATSFIARFIDAAGKETYTDFDKVPAASVWTQYAFNVKVPANVVKMTMLHILNANGELWTDSYSLVKNAPVVSPTPTSQPTTTVSPSPQITVTPTSKPTVTSTPKPTMTPTSIPTPTPAPSSIPNNSFEQANTAGTLPVGWTKSKWGTNSATFEYLNTGRTGQKSAKVTIKNYTDGDAKWSYTPQSVTPGAYYRFTDYYQSDVSTEVAIQVVKADGTEDYLPLHNAPVSSAWAKYTAAFYIPADAVKVAVLHFIAYNGFLITDDYSLTPATPVTFNRPLLSLTFDDGWEENYAEVLPRVEAIGIKTTQCYATTFVKGSGKESIVNEFYNKGHEICSHSITHPDLTTITAAKLTTELKDSKTYLESLVGTGNVTSFAAPYGSYNDNVLTQAQKYYATYRSTDEGYNSRDNFDYYNIRVQNILNTTTAAEVQSWILHAQQTRTWLVLVYHRVANDPEQYDTTPALFDQQLAVIKNSGIQVLTYKNALNEVKSQLP